MDKDLFGQDIAPDYPNGPGHRGIETSIKAAVAMAPKAATWREKVLDHIDGMGAFGATADEVCAAIGCHYRTSQPRISELRRMGKVVDSGLRRKNDSGIHAIVWVVPRFVRVAA